MADTTTSDILKVAMDEFKSIRDEINQRATYCHTLININIIASGTLGGFVFGDPAQADLLLLLPLLSPVLGLLWLDHSYAIRNMGDYINTELKPAVNCTLKGDQELLRWEAYLDEQEKGQRLLRLLPLGIPILIVFSAIPIFALVRSFGEINTNGKMLIWILGLMLTLSFLVLWLLLLFAPYIQGRRAQTSAPAEQPPETSGHV